MWVVSRLVVTFGLLGLIPFVSGAFAAWWWPELLEWTTSYFLLYSAGILAFMAGVFWPLSMQLEACSYPISPMSALLLSQGFFITAGVGLLLPYTWAIVLYPVAYGVLWLADRGLLKGYWPKWYLRLRALLTAVAILSQALVGVALFII
ncbi:DUF3429 domain-containing protein [Marinobacteraceae bacterium S3BR75-40.1]